MEEILVKLEQVTKKYGKKAALDNCSLELKKGKIYGLVGRNGAGKTTMMRIIGGLLPVTSGQVTSKTDIGMLIEAPGVVGSMTARENLHFYGMLSGNADAERETELLELVGLEDDKKKKVKNYSLGMRQRLGIAIALLNHPGFVMLDEPINGLDPIGVVEIRKLITRLNEEFGMTVLISSHNLAELYQTATDYIIIDKGVIKKEISQEALEAENNESLETYFLQVIGQASV
ncbi:MAG: ATP-binding cassette domain-containing protein [Lachnospiraceae bacterium]|nr:ATP-binding cassette domain-containing protein [Lachnospiraceae bacterium]